jgi:hypothetical protein
MRTDEANSLALSTGVELAHAWLQSLADASDARVLFIKGPALQRQALREGRESADVDALICPRDFERMCAEVRARGWNQRAAPLIANITTTHSRTFTHERWPCDLDLHASFPGFLNDSATVFEVLWDHSETLTLAATRCRTTSRAGAALVLTLHSLRGSRLEPRHADELSELARAPFTPAEILETMRIAYATSSDHALPSLFPQQELSAGVSNSEMDATLRRWRERVASGSHGAYFWIQALRESPLKLKTRIAREAIWPTRRDLLLSRPETRDTSVGRTLARIRRWGRGARSLPRAVRAIVGARLTSRTPRRMETPWT